MHPCFDREHIAYQKGNFSEISARAFNYYRAAFYAYFLIAHTRGIAYILWKNAFTQLVLRSASSYYSAVFRDMRDQFCDSHVKRAFQGHGAYNKRMPEHAVLDDPHNVPARYGAGKIQDLNGPKSHDIPYTVLERCNHEWYSELALSAYLRNYCGSAYAFRDIHLCAYG